MSGLSSPWDMAFANDGSMFFTEKCNGLSVRHPDGNVYYLFGGANAALEADDFFCQGQSGMHGIALDPDFDHNNTLYVYMPSRRSSPNTNRVIKLVINSEKTSASQRQDIVEDISFKNSENNWGSAGSHSGGRIRFGPDGYLYITTGDNHDGSLPQDLNRLGGKVLRVDTSGNPAPGNNTPSNGDPRIYTYGHRNVQGITFHPTTGDAIVAEHGPGHSDEVTLLRAGANGGWDPQPEVGVRCADNYCGYTSNNLQGTPTSMTDFKKFPNALRPILSNDDSQGMGPITILTGSHWKAWEGRLAIGIMGGQRLDILEIDSSFQFVGVTTASLPSQRLRSLVQAPDGFLYIATDAGSIWQVRPK